MRNPAMDRFVRLTLLAVVVSVATLAGSHLLRQWATPAVSSTANKIRYELLLPIKDNDGQPIPPEAFRVTYDELAERFGGLTILPEKVQGIWLDQGKRHEDEMVRAYVDVPDDAAARAFFREYEKTLNERFRQQDLYVVSYPVRVD